MPALGGLGYLPALKRWRDQMPMMVLKRTVHTADKPHRELREKIQREDVGIVLSGSHVDCRSEADLPKMHVHQLHERIMRATTTTDLGL